MPKSPAFQFYPKDWLGSTKVDLMTLEEQGGYLRLLCHAWNNEGCDLPDDDDKLSKLSRLHEGWFNGSSEIIKECFLLKKGRLVSERLLEERKKQQEWAEKSSKGGKKSAELRKTKDLESKGGVRVVDDRHQPKPNIAVCSLQSSSSSLSSTASTKKNKEKDIHVFEEIVSHMNEVMGTGYKPKTAKTQRLIKARLDEGFTIDDFKRVHEIKHAEWKDSDYAKFLRPETLYGTKFESYLNQKSGKPLTLAEKNAKTIREAMDEQE